MKRFTALFTTLDQTTKTNAKVDALAAYFTDAPEPDRLWTIALLSGRRPKRTITTTHLREWAAERGGIPLWLFEESYQADGDMAETISLLMPEAEHSSDDGLAVWMQDRLLPLRGLPPAHSSPGFSTLVGLCIYAARDPVDIRTVKAKYQSQTRARGLGLVNRVWRAGRDYF